uniref:Helicase C-terminal domain-containing protein n=1 Tax=Globodera pallida TaxID=36090 RepID=A0A183BUH0_GLOPA
MEQLEQHQQHNHQQQHSQAKEADSENRNFQPSGTLKLNRLRFLVLDEADKLIFDSIFYKSVLKLRDLMNSHYQLQQKHQTAVDKCSVSPPRILMFSATYGDSESNVAEVLRPGFFRVSVGTNDQLVFASTVKQKLIEVESRQQKIEVLFNLLVQLHSGTISGSAEGVTWRRLKTKMLSLKRYRAIPINGDRSQKQRQNALDEFEHGDSDVLVSTNVAARGLNLAGGNKLIVVNFELPRLVEDYVHRIGRTGRAGNIGRALSFIDLGSLAEVQFRDKLVESIVRLNKSPPEIIRATHMRNAAVPPHQQQQHSSTVTVPPASSWTRYTPKPLHILALQQQLLLNPMKEDIAGGGLHHSDTSLSPVFSSGSVQPPDVPLSANFLFPPVCANCELERRRVAQCVRELADARTELHRLRALLMRVGTIFGVANSAGGGINGAESLLGAHG